jgi:hypothetical protein
MRETPIGAVLAGILTSAPGNNPRPVFLGAGVLIVATTAVAWPLVLRPAQHAETASFAGPAESPASR